MRHNNVKPQASKYTFSKEKTSNEAITLHGNIHTVSNFFIHSLVLCY